MATTAMLGETERRRFERTPVLLTGTLRRNDQMAECVVMNLSAHGALIRTDDLVATVSSRSLRVPRFGEFVIDNIWRDGRLAGLRFRDPPQAVARLLNGVLLNVSR